MSVYYNIISGYVTRTSEGEEGAHETEAGGEIPLGGEHRFFPIYRVFFYFFIFRETHKFRNRRT